MLTSQRGQALVGVMVVMIILFALAGAVAIGASTLLNSRGSSAAMNDDFRLRSAMNDAVTQVAGSPRICWGALASPPPSPSPSATPTPLGLSLPTPDGTSEAQCVRVDGVAAGAVKRVSVPQAVNGCRTLTLPEPGPMRLAVMFDVSLSGKGWASLSGDHSTPPSCQLATLASGPCVSNFSFTGAPLASGAAWTQVALSCDIPAGETARLTIKSPLTSPRQVFAAQQDPHANPPSSVYLLAVHTPIAASPMEEVVLFVSGDRTTNSLLYEAPLQP
jgi:hypothetical protein